MEHGNTGSLYARGVNSNNIKILISVLIKCVSPNIIRVITSRRTEWVRHVVWMVERRKAYKSLVQKLEGKRPLGRPKHKWEGIRLDLREIG